LNQFYMVANASVDTSSDGGGMLSTTLGWDEEQQLNLTSSVDVHGDTGTAVLSVQKDETREYFFTSGNLSVDNTDQIGSMGVQVRYDDSAFLIDASAKGDVVNGKGDFNGECHFNTDARRYTAPLHLEVLTTSKETLANASFNLSKSAEFLADDDYWPHPSYCHTHLSKTDPLWRYAEEFCGEQRAEKACDANSKTTSKCQWVPPPLESVVGFYTQVGVGKFVSVIADTILDNGAYQVAVDSAVHWEDPDLVTGHVLVFDSNLAARACRHSHSFISAMDTSAMGTSTMLTAKALDGGRSNPMSTASATAVYALASVAGILLVALVLSIRKRSKPQGKLVLNEDVCLGFNENVYLGFETDNEGAMSTGPIDIACI
jgi:hypothetical protein